MQVNEEERKKERKKEREREREPFSSSFPSVFFVCFFFFLLFSSSNFPFNGVLDAGTEKRFASVRSAACGVLQRRPIFWPAGSWS
jgi:hypothetical protein